MMGTAGVAETRQSGQWHDGVRLELRLTRMWPSAPNTQSAPGRPTVLRAAADKKRRCAQQRDVARAGLPLAVCLAFLALSNDMYVTLCMACAFMPLAWPRKNYKYGTWPSSSDHHTSYMPCHT
jgi:hypothetical protein